MKKGKLVYVPAGAILYKTLENVRSLETHPQAHPVIKYHTLEQPKDLLILQAFEDRMEVLYEGHQWYVNRKDTYREK